MARRVPRRSSIRSARSIRDAACIETLRRHPGDLIDDLEANQVVPANYDLRWRRGEPIWTAFVESAVNEISDTDRAADERVG
jgi:hypothetical protein